MSKVAVVYWSGTGNTEMMAQKVAEGAKEAGAEVSVLTCADFSADDVDAYDAIAFGCPAMGAEELEDTEFEPMFSACESKLSGKKIALFGSYGWGDGEWMRTWEESCKNDGAELVCDSVICADAPDDEAEGSMHCTWKSTLLSINKKEEKAAALLSGTAAFFFRTGRKTRCHLAVKIRYHPHRMAVTVLKEFR